MKEFRDKVAVVTGAASGIGRALAERFAREGMKVVLADVESAALDQAAREIEKTGAAALAVRTDVSRGSDVERCALDADGSEFGEAGPCNFTLLGDYPQSRPIPVPRQQPRCPIIWKRAIMPLICHSPTSPIYRSRCTRSIGTKDKFF